MINNYCSRISDFTVGCNPILLKNKTLIKKKYLSLMTFGQDLNNTSNPSPSHTHTHTHTHFLCKNLSKSLLTQPSSTLSLFSKFSPPAIFVFLCLSFVLITRNYKSNCPYKINDNYSSNYFSFWPRRKE